MKHALASVLLVLASAATAAELPTLGGADFSFPALKDVRAAAAATPSLRSAQDAGSIAMFPLTGNSAILGYAASDAEHDAAVAHWTGVLRSAGLVPGAQTWANGVYTIAYASPSGLQLRRFDADPRQFAPKDPAALEADKEVVGAAMQAAGLKIVTAPTARIDGLLPTYYVYYLAKPAENKDKELQARVLFRGDDIDAALLKKAGINVLEQPKPWLAVYIGPRVSFVTGWAPTKDELRQKLDKRVEYLKGEGLTILGTNAGEDGELDPQYRWVGQVYFSF